LRIENYKLITYGIFSVFLRAFLAFNRSARYAEINQGRREADFTKFNGRIVYPTRVLQVRLWQHLTRENSTLLQYYFNRQDKNHDSLQSDAQRPCRICETRSGHYVRTNQGGPATLKFPLGAAIAGAVFS
jgi:hypothetical protein